MALRGRPTSTTPQDTVEAIAGKVGITIPGDPDTRQNRVAGLGPLTGLAAGIGAGAALGMTRAAGWRPNILVGTLAAGAAAMIAADGPMTALGITDPRTWAVKDWLSDVIPRLAYGFTTAAVLTNLPGA